MADGFDFAFRTLAAAIVPAPPLWVDEWAEQWMYLPKGAAAEHGKYRVERTPPAKEIMRCLSPEHPCRRVVVRGPSQLLKTQVGLNWISAVIDGAPDNMMVLMPTLPLARRISSRISKTIAAVPKLRGAVADVRSRDARNTIDTKELTRGGTLYITTAGSAANLAEIPARYGYADEVDRWEGDVGGEGDPVAIFENRFTTFRGKEKLYYSSSPLEEGYSRISTLFDAGTQRHCYLPCPHCGERSELLFRNLQADDALTRAWLMCPHCVACIDEAAKPTMLRAALEPEAWVAHNPNADGETESFQLNALYAPLGWISWLDLARQRAKAEEAEARGDRGPMQVFVNTREGLPYSGGKLDVSKAQLIDRANAEDYREMVVPAGGLILTCGVDVQHDRLAIVIRAWGREEESWLVYFGEIFGQVMVPGHGVWVDLEALIFGRIPHALGGHVVIRATHVDTSDGTATQDAAYAFCRKHKARGVVAVKGASDRSAAKREIYTPPQRALELDQKLKASKYGLKPHIVGTHKAKDIILEVRLPMEKPGPGYMHVYPNVRADYFDQITAETKIVRRGHGGGKVWDCPAGKRNEALDCEVYALHAARALKLHLWRENVWANVEFALRQGGLLSAESTLPLAVVASQPASAASTTVDDASQPLGEPSAAVAEAPQPVAPARNVAPQRPAAEREWLGDYDNWLG